MLRGFLLAHRDDMAPATPLPGDVISDKYRVLGALGRGGMGTVLEAVHLGTSRRVAIKLLDPNLAAQPEFARRFEFEAKAAALINHPGIVDVLDTGAAADGTPYMVMEHLEGVTVRELERERVRLSPENANAIVVPALEALAAAHASGIVHRDLKPANLFLVVRPARGIKVLDFGISKFAQSQGVTRTGTTIGTPAFMSPEQLDDSSQAGPLSDLYAVGATLYTLLAGRPPFDGASEFELVARILARVPQPLAELRPDIPRSYAELVDRLLSKRPADRPQSALELKSLLLACCGSDPAQVFAAAEALTAAPDPLAVFPAQSTATRASPFAREPVAPPTVADRPPATPTPRARWLVPAVGLLALAATGATQVFVALRPDRQPPAPAVPLAPAAVTEVPKPALPVMEKGAPPEDLIQFVSAMPRPRPEAPSAETAAALKLSPAARLERAEPIMAKARTLASNDLVGAEELLKQELETARRGPDRLAEAFALRNLGNLYTGSNECDLGAERFLAAARVSSALGDFGSVGLFANDIGYLARQCRSLDKIAWFRLAVQARFRAGDFDGARRSAINLGSDLMANRDYLGAEQAYSDALLAQSKFEDPRRLAELRSQVAHAWLSHGSGTEHGRALSKAGAANGVPFDERSGPMHIARYYLAQALEAQKAAGDVADDVCNAWILDRPICAELVARGKRLLDQPGKARKKDKLEVLSEEAIENARISARFGIHRPRSLQGAETSWVDEELEKLDAVKTPAGEAWALRTRALLVLGRRNEARCTLDAERLARARAFFDEHRDTHGWARLAADLGILGLECSNVDAVKWLDAAIEAQWKLGEYREVLETAPWLSRAHLEKTHDRARGDQALTAALVAAAILGDKVEVMGTTARKAAYWHVVGFEDEAFKAAQTEARLDPRTAPLRRSKIYLAQAQALAAKTANPGVNLCNYWPLAHYRDCFATPDE